MKMSSLALKRKMSKAAADVFFWGSAFSTVFHTLRSMRVRYAMRQFIRFVAAGAMIVAVAGLFFSAPIFAQSASKMAQGKVEDNSGRPLTDAIVYLKDTRTLDVKSYITQADGGYRFGQISSNDDYKLWAELNGKKSGVKTISSFDDRKNLLINLHIHTEK